MPNTLPAKIFALHYKLVYLYPICIVGNNTNQTIQTCMASYSLVSLTHITYNT